jgi:two-component system, response regulator RegA
VRTIERILLIDDDERLLSSMARSFALNHDVVTATSFEDATAAAKEQHFDLAIIDIRLGSDSGLDILRTLKPSMPDTKFAIMSGYLTVDKTVECVRAGADVVVTKPVSGSEILRRAELDAPAEAAPETPTLVEVEADHIARVVTDCGGNMSEAARRLGIHRSSLARKLRRPTRRS